MRECCRLFLDEFDQFWAFKGVCIVNGEVCKCPECQSVWKLKLDSEKGTIKWELVRQATLELF